MYSLSKRLLELGGRRLVNGRARALSAHSALAPASFDDHLADGIDRPWSRWSRAKAKGKRHILLMGPPGAAKSCAGRILARRLGARFVDVDDDLLEPAWGCSVGEYREKVGEDAFIEDEAAVLLATDWLVGDSPSDSASGSEDDVAVVALTGSNSLHREAKAVLRRRGMAVFLDVAHDDIVRRAANMKIERIVGVERGLPNLLAQRDPVYQAVCDGRVLAAEGATEHEIADDIVRLLAEPQDFVSTRGGNAEEGDRIGFLQAVKRGLAPDRGLFVPSKLADRQFNEGQLKRLVRMPFVERAVRFLERFPMDGISSCEIREMLKSAYSTFDAGRDAPDSVLPVTELDPSRRQFLVEEFWGPTASFKDLSLQLTPELLARAEFEETNSNSRTGLLVATSGDTGCAALHGFLRADPTRPVVVLYPHNGVSPVQERQMVTAPDSCLVLAVRGNFDDAQTIAKNVLNDKALQAAFEDQHGVRWGSANSINWGRLVPQVSYAASAYLDLVKRNEVAFGEPADVVIPTGNFGNILGAVMAKHVLGVPLGHLVCASNTNNVLYDFIKTGVYDLRARDLVLTSSPSIDILVSSNLERFLHLVSGGDSDTVARLFKQLDEERYFSVPQSWVDTMHEWGLRAHWCDEEAATAAIGDTYRSTGVLLDPHTAVAKVAADAASWRSPGDVPAPTLICATAHWGKFPEAVLSAIGVAPSTHPERDVRLREQWAQLVEAAAAGGGRSRPHPSLAEMMDAEVVHDRVVPATQEAVVDAIHEYLGRVSPQ